MQQTIIPFPDMEKIGHLPIFAENPTMKKSPLILFCLICPFISPAQLLKSKTTVAFSDSLNKVVQAYRNNFRSIQGTELVGQDESKVYRSKIGLPGALHQIIIRSNSTKDTLASWQAVLFEGESYEAAVKSYKNACNQISKTNINGIETKAVPFKGKIELPEESVRFTVSSFRLATTDQRFKKLLAEVELTNTYDGWEVHLNLQYRELEISNAIEE